ncbi:MAG TPA: SdrD B-like domain-containing protein [Kiritimatiellia bacterium]|nr:SdrD B-like domain-containing protein [Kiritimatiellia bacterium]
MKKTPGPLRTPAVLWKPLLIPLFAMVLGLLPHLGSATLISGRVWNDLNEDGIRDPGEPPIESVFITLYDTLTNFVEATASEPDGTYAFTNLSVGNYLIGFIPPPGFTITLQNQGGDDNFDSDISQTNSLTDLIAFSGTAITNVDAGFYQWRPGISLTKLASDGVFTAPDGTDLYVTNETIVTYTYIVTNTGNTYLSFVSLADDILFSIDDGAQVGLVECPNQMAPGDVIVFTTQTVITASVTNNALVEAIPVDFKTCEIIQGLDPVFDEDDAVVIVVTPGYTLDKVVVSPTNRAAAVGETIVFEITVVNTGDVTLVTVPVVDLYDTNYLAYVSAVPASDDNVNDGEIDWSNIGPIAPGDSSSIVASFTAIASTVGFRETNTVVTTPSTPPDFPPVPPQTNDVPYDISNPAFTINKAILAPTNYPILVGQTIDFALIVTNTGDIAIPGMALEDRYDSAILSYIGAVPASVDNANDGVINWSNVGPIPVGASTSVVASFLAIANTSAGQETNVVVGTPTLPPEQPPLPPQTNEVPYDIVNPPLLELDKTFLNATDPDLGGNFTVSYRITVQNIGGAATTYNLTDTPDPDPNVEILGGVVTGHVSGILVGPGPYSITTNELIQAGVSHVYTVRLDAVLSPGVLNGDVQVGQCVAGQVGFLPGNGLFNAALVVYGTNDVRITDDDCGEIPPYILLEKSFIGATPADLLGNFAVTYEVTVFNAGGSSGTYTLTDNPDPDPNVSILGGTVSGQTNLTLLGAGPYLFASNATILAGATHSYTVRLDAALSGAVLSGSTTVSRCSGGPDDSEAGEGLYNEAVVVFGNNNVTITNDACGDIPPFLVLDKQFLSATAADSNGNFTVFYSITVQNSGGSATFYALSDAPDFDANVTVLSNNVSGQLVADFPGGGPYTLATSNTIASGVTHTFNLAIYAQLSSAVLNGDASVTLCDTTDGEFIAGNGLFNEATVVYGPIQATLRDNDCGEIPPVLVLNKDFVGASEADEDGNFTVTYELTVENTGGSATLYSLTDTPAFDANITPLSNNVSGYVTLSLPGSGPYTLATDENIAAGGLHTYTVVIYARFSPDVLAGETNITLCGSITQGPVAGEGLFNLATVVYGTNNLVVTDEDCGNPPPVLVLDKEFDSVSAADEDGNFVVTYTVTVRNTGGTPGQYDLVDQPEFDVNVVVLSNNVSGQITQNFPGSGPYTLATGAAIPAGGTHSYTLDIYARYANAVLEGQVSVTECEFTQSGPTPERGLFNRATVTYGTNQVVLIDEDCGNPPPYLILDKAYISATTPDTNGAFAVTYTITVRNVGGLPETYSLEDTPVFDPAITVTGILVSGHTNFAEAAAVSYTLATDEVIGAGVTHTYIVTVFGVIAFESIGEDGLSDCLEVEGELQPGFGLYNRVTMDFGLERSLTDDDCGPIPPVVFINKSFTGVSSPADPDGFFTVTYQIFVENIGGAATTYSLNDQPLFDGNIQILSNVVSGEISAAFDGSGPYALVSDYPIDSGSNHIFVLTLYVRYGEAIRNGETNATECLFSDNAGVEGQGLLNRVVLSYDSGSVTRSSEACGDPPPFVRLDKTFLNATTPNALGEFTAHYAITVQNSGGRVAFVELTDTPDFDPNITVTGATVSSSQLVLGTLTGQPTFTRPTAFGFNAGCALSNNLSGVGVNIPYVTIPVTATSTGPLTAFIGGGVSDPYLLIYCAFDPLNPLDNLLASNDDYFGEGYGSLQSGFDMNLGITTVPGQTYVAVVTLFSPTSLGDGLFSLTLNNAEFPNAVDFVGSGPFTIATNAAIGFGQTLTVTVSVHGVIGPAIVDGQATITSCGQQSEIPVPGEALFNRSTVAYGIGTNRVTLTDDACGEVPPLLVLEKSFVSATTPTTSGEFSASYVVTVRNAGGLPGSYDLVDTPLFDTNIVVTSAVFSGQANLGFVGAGPYTVAVDVAISAGATHTYTAEVFAILSEAVQRGLVTVSLCGAESEIAQDGEGLFNRATVVYGENDTTLVADDCGDIPLPPGLFIGDTVWVDANSNGSPDENLALFGLNGVQVNLLQAIGGVTNPVDFRITGPDAGQQGYYAFTNLPPYGTYIVEVVLSTVPPGFPISTTPLRYTLDAATAFVGGVFDEADFGFNNEFGTPIELLSFTASPVAGGVELAWETEWEVDTMGYYLYRADALSPDARAAINSELIPGRGANGGAAYSRLDSDVISGEDYLYWLVEEAYDGTLAWYGPVAVHVGEVKRGADLATTELESGAGAVVRVRFESLIQAGVPVSQIPVRSLHILVDGVPVPRVASSDREFLQVGDFLVFYAPPSDTAQQIAIQTDHEVEASGMEWAFVRPRGGGGEVGVAAVDESGSAQVIYAPSMVRMMITGFNSPSVWALDVTDDANPVMLFGQSVVANGSSGQFALYLSMSTAEERVIIAVQDDAVLELDVWRRP